MLELHSEDSYRWSVRDAEAARTLFDLECQFLFLYKEDGIHNMPEAAKASLELLKRDATCRVCWRMP